MGKKKIRREKAVKLLFLVVVFFSLLTYTIYNAFKPAEVKTIEMYLTVGNYTGFDVNASALIFGTVMPSSSAQRTVNITNIDENMHKVYIKPTGELAKWTSISEDKLILKGDESREVKVRVSAPLDAEHGEYTGKLKIIFK